MGETASDGADLGARLRGSVARLYRRMRAERESGELGDAAMMVLAVLLRDGPQTVGALVAHEQVSPATMSELVARLVDSGLATRTRDPDDGRRALVAATDEGLRLAAADRARRHAWLDSLLAELSPQDRAVLERAAELLLGFAER